MKRVLMICASLLVNDVLVSCSTKTVIPVVIKDTKPSFDGNKQDSGLISVSDAGAIVTQRFVDRYNALIGAYGDEPEFLPPLVENQGVVPAPAAEQERNADRGQIYLMEKGTLVHFIRMNQWRKAGREPTVKKDPGVTARILNAFRSL